MATAEDILHYWQELGPDGWYKGSTAIDDEIRARFAPDWEAAARGDREGWLTDARGALAYILLTDQFPRNIHRGEARAYATDAQAVAAAEAACDHGWDRDWPEPIRQFFYLPFMHAEDPDLQARCIEMFATRMPETGADNLGHARAHAWVIDRFGRFPYRNPHLGRDSSPDEHDFLEAGGYRAALDAVGVNRP
ncbi:DUF924 family protein [Frigidibacter sp. MR17.24]|uniref:DUF924 family protein n=1 Tax=Frigidibacter sp. MR17.24 TaxID=3127345 RepID=UPI003012FB78